MSESNSKEEKGTYNLMAVGAIIFVSQLSLFSLIRDVSEPIGIYLKADPFLVIWVGGVLSLVLASGICYFLVRSVWKGISSNSFDQRKFVIILIGITVLIFTLKIFSTNITNSYYASIMKGKFGFFYRPKYLDFKTIFSPILSIIQALILLVILGSKNKIGNN